MKEKASLKTLEEKQSGRGQARINHRVSGEYFLSSYFLYWTLESIAYKFIEYFGNARPLVIRCLFLYKNIKHANISKLPENHLLIHVSD